VLVEGKERREVARVTRALQFAERAAWDGDERRLVMSLHVEPAIHCRLERNSDARPSPPSRCQVHDLGGNPRSRRS
jgi:hypothetical protein